MDDIVLFNECSIDDAKTIGKKGAFLAELASKGFSVPEGFIITGNLFVKFVEMVQLKEQIAEILISSQDNERKSLQIQQIILNAEFPQEMASFIYQNYQKLSGNETEPYIALRVSSTSDYIEDSFFLNIHGRERLINGIKSCWASVFSANNLDLKRFKPSIIVQKMVNSGKSGYIYSYNPLTKNQNEILIQVCSGLGNAISLGQVQPTAYIIKKDELTTLASSLKEQTTQYTLSLQRERTEKVDLQEPVKNILDDFIMKELAKLASRVETRIKEPQRVSFAIDKTIHVIGTQSLDLPDFTKRFGELYQDMQITRDAQQIEPTVQQMSGEQQPSQPVEEMQQPQQNEPDTNTQPMQEQSQFKQYEQQSQSQQSSQQPSQQINQPSQQEQFQQPERTNQFANEYTVGQNNEHQPENNVDDDSIFQHYEPEVHHAPETGKSEQQSFTQFENQTPSEQASSSGMTFNQSQQQNNDNEQQPQQNEQHTVNQQAQQHSAQSNQYEQQSQSQQPSQQINQSSEQEHVQQQPEQTRDQFMNEHMPDNPQVVFSKAIFQASASVITCDLAINTALKKKYKELYYKEPPVHLEQLLNELKMKLQIPYEDDVRLIRRLRDTLLTYAKEPSGSEIHKTLTITKQFLNEF